MEVQPARQGGRGPRRIFVLGVYASAVHARWLRADGSTAINALAVASEPEIFWRRDGVAEVISRIPVPAGAGRLVPAGASLNGPSGRALDESFLAPLGVDRSQAWLCDLLPESRCNPKQAAALAREYVPVMARFGLPSYDFPPVPAALADEQRVGEIESEIAEAQPQVLVTLGDQPLKWFTKRYGSKSRRSLRTVKTATPMGDCTISRSAVAACPFCRSCTHARRGDWEVTRTSGTSSTATGCARSRLECWRESPSSKRIEPAPNSLD
jgi:uracil-DNA glycosylase